MNDDIQGAFSGWLMTQSSSNANWKVRSASRRNLPKMLIAGGKNGKAKSVFPPRARDVFNFNHDWHFRRGENAEATDKWQRTALPHSVR
ncbi:MAG TPA: hypothetical protein VKK61_01335, partial [Tepidisphaeraceae bacterium]|nr:hypothetical protein [Tepidisphaeraceae bacterium]